jgi:hypothetical protein
MLQWLNGDEYECVATNRVSSATSKPVVLARKPIGVT